MESLFFWVSKLIWLFIAPDTMVVFVILLLWALLWRGYVRWAKRLGVVCTVIIFIIALFPVGKWILHPLDARFIANPILPKQVDGIIVLSGSEALQRSASWQQVELNDAAERLLGFMALA